MKLTWKLIRMPGGVSLRGAYRHRGRVLAREQLVTQEQLERMRLRPFGLEHRRLLQGWIRDRIESDVRIGCERPSWHKGKCGKARISDSMTGRVG